MIYFGDGMTDIPCMKIVKLRGGTAIAVYRPKSKNKDNAVKLLADNRVDFALPADYRENTELDQVVKTILNRMAAECDLDILKMKEDSNYFVYSDNEKGEVREDTKVVFTNTTIERKEEIKEVKEASENPRTLDNIFSYIVIGIISLIMIILGLQKYKKING